MFKQRAPIRTRSPRLVDIYWAAGFLEGEGCFASRESPHSRWKNGTVLGVDILAVQVQKEPLERLQACFGGSLKQRQQGGEAYSHYQPIWRWSLTSSRAIALMMTLYLLMSPVRQAQIRKAVLMWRTRPLKRHWAHCPKGHEFTIENTYYKLRRSRGTEKAYRYRLCRECRRIQGREAWGRKHASVKKDVIA